jgi:hypothetical protein
MSLLDRDELLARTDLADLATQICGPARGRGRSSRWHCPNPEHPDEHPSMGIYLNGHGLQRWKCHVRRRRDRFRPAGPGRVGQALRARQPMAGTGAGLGFPRRSCTPTGRASWRGTTWPTGSSITAPWSRKYFRELRDLNAWWQADPRELAMQLTSVPAMFAI